jgi:hypothetical protein
MSDDDEPTIEVASPPVMVPETSRLWKLTPALNLLEKSRQIAIVPAENEDDARAIATTADPMERNWRDELAFTADSIETSERHVIGDVIFSIDTSTARSEGEASQEGLNDVQETEEN